MHPYRMQQLIKERGKDRVINVQRRASLYQTISQLQRAGLIAARDTSRDEKRPERTTYVLTEKGYATAQNWLREALSTPSLEYPEFPAAVSFLPLLTPEDALRQLEKRALGLMEKLDEIEAAVRSGEQFLARLFLLEEELMRATLEAELKWVRGVIDDLRSGQLTWSEEWLRGFLPPESDTP